MGVRLSTEAIVPVSSRLTLLPPDLHNHVAHPLPQGCGKVEAPIGANPFRTKSQMVQISTQMAQIRSTFNQRGTPTSLPCRREAICNICESICEIDGVVRRVAERFCERPIELSRWCGLYGD